MPDDSTSWTVTDDWPEDVPVTEAEIEVFEAWFGDLFDELFSTRLWLWSHSWRCSASSWRFT